MPCGALIFPQGWMWKSSSKIMTPGLVGFKIGMTRLFTESGEALACTVVCIDNNRVSQIKSVDKDGYAAIQVAFGEKRPGRTPRPLRGHFAKAGLEPAQGMREFRLKPESLDGFSMGQALAADLFSPGAIVDVTGVTKGRGFSGVIRRHNMRRKPVSHGNSVTTRAPGSIGQRQDPGRVFPGMKMAGHYGDERVTVQNLEVLRVDPGRGLLWIKGAIPGAVEGVVFVRPAVKRG